MNYITKFCVSFWFSHTSLHKQMCQSCLGNTHFGQKTIYAAFTPIAKAHATEVKNHGFTPGSLLHGRSLQESCLSLCRVHLEESLLKVGKNRRRIRKVFTSQRVHLQLRQYMPHFKTVHNRIFKFQQQHKT